MNKEKNAPFYLPIYILYGGVEKKKTKFNLKIDKLSE